MTRYNIIFLLAYILGTTAQAQTIEPGSVAESYLRFNQVNGTVGDSLSFVNRPYHLFLPTAKEDSGLLSLVRSRVFYQKKKKVFVGLLPLSVDQQYLSRHPFAQNDGAMIPAKGYQAKLSAGIFAMLGPLFVQLKPELVWAGNRPYPTHESFGSLPKGPYRKIFPGQTTASLHLGPAAVNISSQNLWWGPGVHHSLLMTNQAPGFVHLKFHSFKPLRTPVGTFEWTILGGKLVSDSSRAYDNNDLRPNLISSIAADRYLNAYVLTFQPTFVKGLNIGFSRALQIYWTSLSSSNETLSSRYLPIILKPVRKDNTINEDSKTIDQLASAFFRWHWPRGKAELYGEYGFNDYKANNRDFILNMPHSAAYILGFRKVVAGWKNAAWSGGIEVTQLAQSADQLVRNAGNWYYHGGIDEGYTHQNQVLGAAFASNTQTVELVRQKQTQRSSFIFQRFQRDPHRNAPRWNDWVLGVSHSQPYKGFYLTADFKGIFSRNYAWQTNSNPFQILAKAGVRYYFHD